VREGSKKPPTAPQKKLKKGLTNHQKGGTINTESEGSLTGQLNGRLAGATEHGEKN
jgi:hypothetical protein